MFEYQIILDKGDNTYIAPQRRPVRRQAQRQRADVPEAHPV